MRGNEENKLTNSKHTKGKSAKNDEDKTAKWRHTEPNLTRNDGASRSIKNEKSVEQPIHKSETPTIDARKQLRSNQWRWSRIEEVSGRT